MFPTPQQWFTHLTCCKGFDAPKKLGNILDWHLEVESISLERQHLWLFQKLTPSGPLCCHHSLGKKSVEGQMMKLREVMEKKHIKKKTFTSQTNMHIFKVEIKQSAGVARQKSLVHITEFCCCPLGSLLFSIWKMASFAYQQKHLFPIHCSVTSTNWLPSNIHADACCHEVTPSLQRTNPTSGVFALALHQQLWHDRLKAQRNAEGIYVLGGGWHPHQKMYVLWLKSTFIGACRNVSVIPAVLWWTCPQHSV